jgi:hypothetical protein
MASQRSCVSHSTLPVAHVQLLVFSGMPVVCAGLTMLSDQYAWLGFAAFAGFLFLLQANRAHTYLGKREAEWHETQDEKDIYPDFITMAKSFGVPAKRVIKKTELRAGGRLIASIGVEKVVVWVCLQGCRLTSAGGGE